MLPVPESTWSLVFGVSFPAGLFSANGRCLLWHPQASPAWISMVFVFMHLIERETGWNLRPSFSFPGQGVWWFEPGPGVLQPRPWELRPFLRKGCESRCLRSCCFRGALGAGGRTDPTGHWEEGPGPPGGGAYGLNQTTWEPRGFSDLFSQKSFRSAQASSCFEEKRWLLLLVGPAIDCRRHQSIPSQLRG